MFTITYKQILMSTELLEEVTASTKMREDVYQQFCLDAKRINVFIDGKYDQHVSENCLYTWIINLFENEKKGLWFAFWCTQTSLANIYQRKVKTLNNIPLHLSFSENTNNPSIDRHLVDDGRQRVYIKLSYIQREEAELCLLKPFRVCYLNNEHLRTLYYLHLHIFVDTHSLGKYNVKWIRFDSFTPLDVHTKQITNEDDTWVIVS